MGTGGRESCYEDTLLSWSPLWAAGMRITKVLEKAVWKAAQMGAFTYRLLTPLARVPSHGAVMLSHAQVARV